MPKVRVNGLGLLAQVLSQTHGVPLLLNGSKAQTPLATLKPAGLGCAVTKREVHEHWHRAQLLLNKSGCALKGVAIVVSAGFGLTEIAQYDGLLLAQHPCVQQLKQHALNFVGWFIHVFKYQNSTLDFRHPGCSQQTAQQR